jgi:hypothetical protein
VRSWLGYQTDEMEWPGRMHLRMRVIFHTYLRVEKLIFFARYSKSALVNFPNYACELDIRIIRYLQSVD